MTKIRFHEKVLIDCTHNWSNDEQEVTKIEFEEHKAIVYFSNEYKQSEFSADTANSLLDCEEIVDSEGNKAVELNITGVGDFPYMTIDFTDTQASHIG